LYVFTAQYGESLATLLLLSTWDVANVIEKLIYLFILSSTRGLYWQS
jgi:hypothetical protein